MGWAVLTQTGIEYVSNLWEWLTRQELKLVHKMDTNTMDNWKNDSSSLKIIIIIIIITLILFSCLTVVADGAVLQGNFNKQPDGFPTLKGQCHEIFCFLLYYSY